MCTAVTYQGNDHYFGRNLDLDHHYKEAVTVTPRNYCLHFHSAQAIAHHYAMIGMATVVDGYPLYYDAVNEHGLSIAGLHFPGNAAYDPHTAGKDNITPFELIPWLLAQCKTVDETKILLEKINLLDVPFSPELPLTPLHWLLADREKAVTIEPMADGLKQYDNPIGVLTNNPPFPYHTENLKNYLNLTAQEPCSRFAPNLKLLPYGCGLGAYGLPGDLSSVSRFVRAAFTKLNAAAKPSNDASVNQFFHILGAVSQTQGCVKTNRGYAHTVYTGCCNMDRGIYYYTTYENSQITGVDMHREDLDSNQPVTYPLVTDQQIRIIN